MNPPPNPPKLLAWLVFIGLVNAALLALLFWPVAPAMSLAVLVIIVVVAVAASLGRLAPRGLLLLALRGVKTIVFGRTPVYLSNIEGNGIETGTSPRQRALRYVIEIVVIVVAAVVVTGQQRYISPTLHRLAGHEAEWLTSYAYFASQNLREYGYIPKWQPYFEWGEPFINNPFSFVLNPFSIAPSLIFGPAEGIKISIAVYAILAGLGGWFLGKMLGCGSMGRLLLALLLIGKGNMFAMLGTGYFQLGTSQAYFGWIIGGTLGIFWLPNQRWPVALTAIMLTLMFFAGNIWYLLPTLFSMALLAGIYGWIMSGRVDWLAVKRLTLTGLLTVGMSAITLLPIWAERQYIGDHPNEIEAGSIVPLPDVIRLFFVGDMLTHVPIRTQPSQPQDLIEMGRLATFYYSYVVPFWFAALVFAIPLYRGGRLRNRGVWVVGAAMIIVTVTWGAGGSPLFVWLYEHVPLLGQWRFVGRALAVASFWIAVLVALRADGLWQALSQQRSGGGRGAVLFLRSLAFIVLTAGLVAVYQVNKDWGWVPLTEIPSYVDEVCISWLRKHHPTGEITALRGGYSAIYTYLKHHVREFSIEADFTALPLPNTLGQVMLTHWNSLPEYALAFDRPVRLFLLENGYRAMPQSQLISDRYCLWHKSDALPYAYIMPLAMFEGLTGGKGDTLQVEQVTPIRHFERRPGEIGLVVQADKNTPSLVTVQELAYPGWFVEVDGRPAQLEVAGGQIAVLLPDDGVLHTVYFTFRPPLLYFGGWITLISCALCASYLLQLERFFVSGKSARVRLNPR